MKKMLIVLIGLCTGTAWARGYEVSNPMAKEGMALSRIALSPVNIIGHAYAQIEHHGTAGVILSPIFIVGAVPGGVMATSCDILTGLGEMLTLEQCNRVSYPWQSFDYEASDRWMEIAYKTLEIIGEVAEKTEKVSNDINSIKHKGGSTTTQTGAASASQPSDGNSVSPTYGSTGTRPGNSGPKVKPRVRHSSCGGSGICPICRGRRIVGDKKCIGCGGSARCRACGGSGYAK